MQTSDLIAAGALIASLFSLLISIRGHYIAKRAMVIAETDHQDKYKEIIGYLINGFKWTEGEKAYASFAVSYTNNASHPNSFKDIVLEIEYYGAGRVFNKAKFPPSVGVLPVNLRDNWENLKAPINISPKETKSGWITFQLPYIDGRRINIETYRIIATSASEKTTIVESYILKSVVHNEK